MCTVKNNLETIVFLNFETKQDIEKITADLNSMKSNISVLWFLRKSEKVDFLP